MQLHLYASKYAKHVMSGHFVGDYNHAMHNRYSNVLHSVGIKHTHGANSFASPCHEVTRGARGSRATSTRPNVLAPFRAGVPEQCVLN